jgi:hypothetical protein
MRSRTCRGEDRRMGELRWIAAAMLALVCAGGVCPAQTPRESDVEAAYLFNFAKFMHAPVHSADNFTIAVVGKSALEPALETITANEQVDGRPLKVMQVATPEQARNCDIIFLGESETGRIDRDLAALAGSNALTVSSAPDFMQRGGMIQFQVVNNRVRFNVNLDAASKEKVTLSSELLKVALSVRGTAATEGQP